MTFAGLSNPQERADLMAFLNTRDSSPLPLPAAPAAGADPEAQANQNVAGSGTNDGAQKAENEPPADLKKESSLGAGSGGEAAPGAGPSDSDGN
jgi:cytochrome c